MQISLYFGHPVNTYGTELEQRLMKKIYEAFPGRRIVNPNMSDHQRGYDRYKALTGCGMDYFNQEVLPSCHGGVFLAFRDGKWGAGVFKEALYYSDRGFPIWRIDPEGFIDHLVLANVQPLTVEETRDRIRTASGATIPYI